MFGKGGVKCDAPPLFNARQVKGLSGAAVNHAVPLVLSADTAPGASARLLHPLVPGLNPGGPLLDRSCTTEEFVEAAAGIIAGGLEQHSDVPELWAVISRFSKVENCAVCECSANRLLNVSRLHSPGANTAFLILTALAGYHAGLKSAAGLRATAEAMVLAESQSALTAGFHFHVQQLMDRENPVYQLENYVCKMPFTRLDVLSTSSHLCCASRLHKSAGNLAEQDYPDVWNSPAAAEIRLSVLDGSYRFCNKISCPYLIHGKLSKKADLMEDPWWADVLQNKKGKIDRFPELVNLAYDRHCNLYCPSCRSARITTNDTERAALDTLTQRNIYPLLARAGQVSVTGSGDPFASKTFRQILEWISDETCPQLKVELKTNGLLFTEKEWARFPNLKGRISGVYVSVDGACKATHELLRRGSRWETMMENLPFIGTLLQRGEIEKFQLCFLVQQENYREMGDFVELAARVGASHVYFERITNWGTFSPAQYEKKAVFNRNHPEHRAFLNAMQDQRLLRPGVNIGSFATFLPPIPQLMARPVGRQPPLVAIPAFASQDFIPQ
jgi:MoaA/NifB/PqqE/SkfB family radical SAM enzyme